MAQRKNKFQHLGGIKIPKYATADYMRVKRDVGVLARIGIIRPAMARVMLEASFGDVVSEGEPDISTPRVDSRWN